MATQNETAKAFKALHQRTGKPLVLANVWDVLSARAVAELPASEAIATGSYAIAQAAGMDDGELTAEANLAAVRAIAKVIAATTTTTEEGKGKGKVKPLTADMQDGYGEDLERVVDALIDAGVAGVNLEDSARATGALLPADEAASRVARVLAAAARRGVPDFVVNARCDALVAGSTVDEAVARGRGYLAAGATTVFVWGRARGVARPEVERLVRAFDGRLAVIKSGAPGALSVAQLAEMGVARISVGPAIMHAAFKTVQDEARKLLE